MIFVTVGTHEQPFNRLVEYMDKLVEKGEIKEEIVIQTGYSTYEPINCSWKNLFTYQQMTALVNKARIVITHGGPSSFIMPLQIGKVPIVVPRQLKYGEHVNDHQLRFVEEVEERMGIIIAVTDLTKLSDVIKNYDSIVEGRMVCYGGNNEKFNQKLAEIVNGMFEGK